MVPPSLLTVAHKAMQIRFDGGRLTSDAGVLVLAEIERRLRIAERLARCILDPRAPGRVRHGIAEMIRFRILLIAAGYPDANDCDALRTDPAFKMALGRFPESGADLCSQPTMSRLENLPTPTTLKRIMASMIELFCDSFAKVPRRIVLDIDDTEDRAHGRQQLARFHAHYNSRCFLPIHIYEAITGRPIVVILRAAARKGPPSLWALPARSAEPLEPDHCSILIAATSRTTTPTGAASCSSPPGLPGRPEPWAACPDRAHPATFQPRIIAPVAPRSGTAGTLQDRPAAPLQ